MFHYFSKIFVGILKHPTRSYRAYAVAASRSMMRVLAKSRNSQLLTNVLLPNMSPIFTVIACSVRCVSARYSRPISTSVLFNARFCELPIMFRVKSFVMTAMLRVVLRRI